MLDFLFRPGGGGLLVCPPWRTSTWTSALLTDGDLTYVAMFDDTALDASVIFESDVDPWTELFCVT